MSTPLHPDFDDPLKMARALRTGYFGNPEVVKKIAAEHIERLVAENEALRKAVAEEREACAQVCDGANRDGNWFAAAIRARGEGAK